MATQVKSLNTTKLDSKLDINDLTDVSLTGSGVLDKFLQLQRLVLDREFNDGRIHGKEYADSFIATYTINMELAIKFLLEKEKQFYEIELIESQIANSKKELELKEYELTKIKPIELEALMANKELIKQKIITERAQTDASVIGPDSVIDWNIKVLEAQVKGIDQEAKQKIMNLLLSTWTTRMNNDAAEPEPAGLGDSVIKSTVAAAKASAGII